MSLHEAMTWRYATKKFDPSSRLSTAQVEALLGTAALAPSSFGLQPYAIINVANPALRQRISAAAMGQPQVSEASHLLVLAAETHVDEQTVAGFIDRAAALRGVERSTLAAREAQIAGAVMGLDGAARLTWAQKQAYLALGVLLTAAAQAQIDACPMEGFNAPEVDAILGLPEKRLSATVLVTLGTRDAGDPAAKLPKVRKSGQELVIAA